MGGARVVSEWQDDGAREEMGERVTAEQNRSEPARGDNGAGDAGGGGAGAAVAGERAGGVSAAQGSVRPLPRWVRVLDGLIVCAAALLFSNLVFHGFRLKVYDVDVSATSWERSAVVLVVLLAFRFWRYRERPVWVRLRDRVAAGWRSDARRVVLPPFLSSRAMVLVAGYFAVMLIGYAQSPPFRISRNEFVNLPMKWDAGWYLSVALDGYHYNPTNKGQQNIAFFPAFPMLTRVGAAFFGAYSSGSAPPRGVSGINQVEYAFHQHRRTVLAGMIISLGAFGWSLVYLFRFARDLLGDEAAGGAVAMACAYPFALFFSAFYTESLFFLGVIAVCYHMERRDWRAAIGWGLLVGLTRPNGCLLSVPLAFIALRQACTPGEPRPFGLDAGTARGGGRSSLVPIRESLRGWQRPDARRLATGLAVAAMPGIGMLLFSAFMYQISGNPFVWLEAHHAWGRVYEGIDTLVSSHLDVIQSQGLYGYSTHASVDGLNALAAGGALLAVVPIARRIGLAYGLFILLMLLPPLAAGGFLSLGRVSSTLFPLFVYLGWRCRDDLRTGVLIGGALLQGLFAALYFTWREMF